MGTCRQIPTSEISVAPPPSPPLEKIANVKMIAAISTCVGIIIMLSRALLIYYRKKNKRALDVASSDSGGRV
jgi:hypothetical protein